jgi:hypothetical protein
MMIAVMADAIEGASLVRVVNHRRVAVFARRARMAAEIKRF